MALALSATLSASLLSGCVVVPRTDMVYDPDCKLLRRQMVLDVQQIGAFGGCANEACAVLLVTLGAVAAASAVVSGSIALVGNAVYWLEQQGRCQRDPRAVPAAPVSAPAAGGPGV